MLEKSPNRQTNSQILSFLTCGFYTKRDASNPTLNRRESSSKTCGMRCSQSNMVRIYLGNTILLKNSTTPMLEVQVEIDSDYEQIQNNDILYLMNEDVIQMPKILQEMDPKRKIAIEQSDMAANIGRALVNLSNVESGTYILRYIRLSEPIQHKSKLEILGTSPVFFMQKYVESQRISSTPGKNRKKGSSTYLDTTSNQIFNNDAAKTNANSMYIEDSTQIVPNSLKSSILEQDKRQTQSAIESLLSSPSPVSFNEMSYQTEQLKKLLQSYQNDYETIFGNVEQITMPMTSGSGGEDPYLPSYINNYQNNGKESGNYQTQKLNIFSHSSNNRLFTVEEVNSNYSGEQGREDLIKKKASLNSKSFLKRLNSEKSKITKILLQERDSFLSTNAKVTSQQMKQSMLVEPQQTSTQIQGSLKSLKSQISNNKDQIFGKRHRSLTAKTIQIHQTQELLENMDMQELEDEELEDGNDQQLDNLSNITVEILKI